jgi:hypothetical protein
MPRQAFNTPFEALKQQLDTAPDTAKSEDQTDPRREFLADRFEALLKGRFGDIPPGSRFESDLEGVVDITLISVKAPAGNDRAMAIIFYKAVGKDGDPVERSVTLPLTDSGALSGKLPSELRHLSKGQILDEILDNVEAEGLDDWLDIQDGVIIPPGEWESSGKKGSGEKSRERAALDRDRFRFFRQQSNLLCKIRPGENTRIRYGSHGQYGPKEGKAGLTDYHAFVFPKGVMFENAVTENNLYFFTFDQPIAEDLADQIKRKKLDPNSIQQELLKRGFFDTATKTKNELRLEGKRYPKKHPHRSWPKSRKRVFYDELEDFINTNLA